METVTGIFQRFYKEILASVALVLVGVILSPGVVPSSEPYNPFEDKAQEVDRMMQDTLKNPTSLNLGTAQDELFYTYYPWAERQAGDDKETFIDYLEVCNQVIIQTSKGEDADTSKMNELRDTLLS